MGGWGPWAMLVWALSVSYSSHNTSRGAAQGPQTLLGRPRISKAEFQKLP